MGREDSQKLLVPKVEAPEKDMNVAVGDDVLPGSNEGGGCIIPSPSTQKIEQQQQTISGGGSNSKKRIRTATVLDEVDKKFLLEQYVSERQKNVNLQLQNRVSQLERELRDKERAAQEKEKLHLETLALAESHHRENVLGEIGRLLETEFNCSICNDIYIDPAVLSCGHTYCSYCINRALAIDCLCPVCRTGYNFNPPSKNIEMRNFINKIFQMLPEDMRTTRDQVLQERAALPNPSSNENNRNRSRRRRSRSVSPFDLFGMFNDDDAFRERRSRSRSVSTLSDSDDSDDDSAISFFDLRASPRSPSPPERPVRSRTRSRSPTASSRRRRSPTARYSGGLIPLPWRSPFWASTPASRTSRYASPSITEDRRPRQTARRGRAFSTGRSFAGTTSGGRRYGWGPPRRQIHPIRESTSSNNNIDNNIPSSSGSNVGASEGNRRRMSLLSPYRPFTHRSGRWVSNFGPTRDSPSTSSALRIQLPIPPRMVRRPLPIPDSFEDTLSRRDPPANFVPGCGPSTASTGENVSVSAPQPMLNHDHSYTSNAASVIVAAISAARSRPIATTSVSQSTGNTVPEANSTVMSDIERLEQTRRLYASNAAASSRSTGTGTLSQALAMLSPPSASDNLADRESSSILNNHASVNISNITNLISNEIEPRRSPRIASARQFRHRFLAPISGGYRETERQNEHNMNSENEINNQDQNQSSSNGHGQDFSQQENQSSRGNGSVISSTGGTRGSSVGDSPTSSEMDAMPSIAPIDSAGIDAMRRFVHDLHNYRGSGRDTSRADSSHRDRDRTRDRRSTAIVANNSRSSRDNRPRSGRRSSVDVRNIQFF
ncbi:uncharacterized protein LOC110844037 isoform X2 [Folsomia candida]|uniref:E3 ubiquitin-protein ligase RNF8 n=1 Tax=Folsomia candida TaxID=158441 RepID=A0A226EVE5_FOLCA|nr:uncharacterized protein LOC110844037 isoform X2 [Folsomia candida]XP_035703388.1 uncharacterized protein LOC110844037 isoform X2 [Folsomia candida]OXA61147.1 E3 ubiquitin-protein ligase RNF8 [Folsomia candida]